MKTQPFVLTVFGFLCLTASTAAQGVDRVGELPTGPQDMERVRALYVAAAYEEALAAMPAGLSTAAGTELEQYRALCLLALGREADARATIERLVKAHPTFVPPADDVSPRMRALFTTVRSALMPALAKQAYVDAKAAYEAKTGMSRVRASSARWS